MGLTLRKQGSCPALALWRPGPLGPEGALVKGQGSFSCPKLTAREKRQEKTRHRDVGSKHALPVFIERLLYAGI